VRKSGDYGFRGVDVCLFFFVFQGKPPDWQNFVGIIMLLIINFTISFIEEKNLLLNFIIKSR
jgi:hypothetical protein